MYNVEIAQMSEAPRKTDIEGAVLQIRKIGNSVGLILPEGLRWLG